MGSLYPPQSETGLFMDKTQHLQTERYKCSSSGMILTGMPCAWHLGLLARWWLVLVYLY